ncbi:kinase-like domain-containing protein [Rhizophagus clarus]|uniref:Kinase-like domain-containing protein n=1 Tax=Rhizophagus clarus TaxID=94130 RepID=A0A8H3LTI0_9GLOM|nr:kinase-like domain-containing protein [Rhizophagus clarus]
MQSTNNSDNTINDSKYEFSKIIQNFHKIDIKEIEPTTQDINENIYESLSPVINELVDLYFEAANKGKEEIVRKQQILDYINNYEISSQEIYKWLLNTPNNSNSIFLLGYFNFYGIGTSINKQKAFELYKKAVKLENMTAQLVLADIYIHGKGLMKDCDKAFKLTKKLAEKEHLAGINMLGYCYGCGVGTNVNMIKAFGLYKKAADLGNSIAQYNIALLYEHGKGVEQDEGEILARVEKALSEILIDKQKKKSLLRQNSV